LIAVRISQDDDEEEDTGDTRKGSARGEDMNEGFWGICNGRQRVVHFGNAFGKVKDRFRPLLEEEERLEEREYR
jgi:hypothetical protein